MTDIALWAVPTTGQDRLESIFRYFQTAGPRTGGSEFWPVVVLVVAVLALGWLLSRFLTRSQQKQRPWALFLAYVGGIGSVGGNAGSFGNWPEPTVRRCPPEFFWSRSYSNQIASPTMPTQKRRY